MPRARPCTLALVLALAAAGGAGAYRYEVREWSAAWDGFADDFEDGILPVGGPGEAPIYTPICGVTPASETGGALVLAGPDAACPANPGAVLATTGGTTVGETRATFRFQVPELGQSYGITLSDPGSSDFATLMLARNEVPGLVADALLVVLLADPIVGALPTPVQFQILSVVPPHQAVSAAAIELRLVTAPSGGRVLPAGSFRLCASSPCEDEATTPFVALAPAIPPSADEGALDPGIAHGPTLSAFSFGGAFSFAVEEWRTRGSASDDFEAEGFGDAAPYVFSCGTPDDVEQAGGLLALLGPVPPCGATGLAFLAGLPGPLTARAVWEFAVPGRCEAYGLSLGAGAADFAFLSLVRSEDPLDPGSGAEALYVTLTSEAESGGPAIPVVAAARVSGAPLDDPALAEVRAIELELELAADLAGLVPTGRFRLCTEAGCPLDFTPLEPGATAPDPEALRCGLPAASYDPPTDAGALAWQGPVGASLYATRIPEPGSAAAGAAALAALAALRPSRRSHRCPTKT